MPDISFMTQGAPGTLLPQVLVNTEDEKSRKDMAIQGAISSAAWLHPYQSKEFIETFYSNNQQLQNKPTKDDIKITTNSINQEAEKEDVRNVVRGQFYASPLEMQLATENAVTAIKDIEQERATKPNQFEDDFTFAITEQDNDFTKRVKVQLSIYNQLDQILKDRSLLDKITDYLGLLVSDTPLTVAKLTDSGVVTPGELASIGAQWVEHFQSLTPEEQQEQAPELIKQIMEESGVLGGNAVKAAQFIQALADPVGGDKVKKMVQDEAAFLETDVATFLGMGLFKVFGKLTSGAGALGSTQKLNPKMAGKLQTLSATDNVFAEGVNTTQLEAQTKVRLFNGLDVDPEYDKMMAFHANEDIAKIQQAVDFSVQEIEGKRLREGILSSPSDIEDATERVLKEAAYPDSERLISTTPEVSENGVLLKHEIGTKTQGYFSSKKGAQNWINRHNVPNASVKLGDNGYYIEQRQFYNFKEGDISELPESGIGLNTRGLASPSWVFDEMGGEDIVKAASRAEMGRAFLEVELTKLRNEIFSNTLGKGWKVPGSKTRKQLRRVEQVLDLGDQRSKSYDYFSLKYGFKLDEQQIGTYFGLRRLFDNFWWMRNMSDRNVLVAQGMKKVSLKFPEGDYTLVGKLYNESGDASRAIANRVIFDTTTGKESVLLGPDIVNNVYNRGHRIVRVHGAPKKFNGKYYSFLEVSSDDISELPLAVNRWKEGYVPKLNKNTYFFVRQFESAVIDGEKSRVLVKTLRAASSKKEAEVIAKVERELRENIENYTKFADDEALQWLKDNGFDPAQIEDDFVSGKLNLSSDIEVTLDRQLTEADIREVNIGMSGGLFTGPRSKDLRYGIKGENPERYNAFDALQRNISNLAKYMSVNEWRSGVNQKLLKTYRPYMVDKKVSNILDAQIHERWKDEPIANGLRYAKNYMRAQLKIPTISESRWSRQMERWAEFLEKTPAPDWARYSLLDLSKRDPFAIAKGLAFDGLLGFWNPVQLYVQAQGASIAVGLYPQYAAQATKDWIALRWAMYPFVPRNVRAMISKAGFKNAEEFEEYRNLFINSGLRDSVRSNADYEMLLTGASASARTIRNVLNSGLIFYREGELTSRGIALSIALRKWRKENPGAVLNSVAQKEVIDETLRITLNLLRSNAASWQHGILGIPTQFLQVHAKATEAVLGGLAGRKGWSKADAYKFMLSQLLFYGSVGVPFGALVVQGTQAITGTQLGELPKETQKYLKGGLPDLMAYMILGADIEAGGRSAIAFDITNRMTSFVGSLIGAPLFDSEVVDLNAMFGAFGATGSRFLDGMKMLGPLIVYPSVDKNVELTPSDFALAVGELAKTASTFSNAQKAWLWYKTGELRSSRGTLLSVEQPNTATAIMKALGFQSTTEADVIGLLKSNVYHDYIEKENADHLVKYLLINMNGFWDLSDEEKQQRGEKVTAYFKFFARNMDPLERQRLQERVIRKLLKEESIEQRELKKFIDRMGTGIYDNISPFNANPHLNSILLPEEEKSK